MKKLKGYTVTKLTDTEIVQEGRYIFPDGTGARVVVKGNPNPDPKQQERAIEDISRFLCYIRDKYHGVKTMA